MLIFLHDVMCNDACIVYVSVYVLNSFCSNLKLASLCYVRSCAHTSSMIVVCILYWLYKDKEPLYVWV